MYNTINFEMLMNNSEIVYLYLRTVKYMWGTAYFYTRQKFYAQKNYLFNILCHVNVSYFMERHC